MTNANEEIIKLKSEIEKLKEKMEVKKINYKEASFGLLAGVFSTIAVWYIQDNIQSKKETQARLVEFNEALSQKKIDQAITVYSVFLKNQSGISSQVKQKVVSQAEKQLKDYLDATFFVKGREDDFISRKNELVDSLKLLDLLNIDYSSLSSFTKKYLNEKAVNVVLPYLDEKFNEVEYKKFSEFNSNAEYLNANVEIYDNLNYAIFAINRFKTFKQAGLIDIDLLQKIDCSFPSVEKYLSSKMDPEDCLRFHVNKFLENLQKESKVPRKIFEEHIVKLNRDLFRKVYAQDDVVRDIDKIVQMHPELGILSENYKSENRKLYSLFEKNIEPEFTFYNAAINSNLRLHKDYIQIASNMVNMQLKLERYTKELNENNPLTKILKN